MTDSAAPSTPGGGSKADAEAPGKTAPNPEEPARELPSQEEIAAWVAGDDLPTLAHLFDQLDVKRFDALVMQIRKEELLPQHWQVISSLGVTDDDAFDRLPEVGRLRAGYRDQELSRRRLAGLRTAWRELRGKKPSLWTVPDLLAGVRRILDKGHEVDWHDLLSAVRDVWAGLSLPHGREQLEILWACLAFVRTKTKK